MLTGIIFMWIWTIKTFYKFFLVLYQNVEILLWIGKSDWMEIEAIPNELIVLFAIIKCFFKLITLLNKWRIGCFLQFSVYSQY